MTAKRQVSMLEVAQWHLLQEDGFMFWVARSTGEEALAELVPGDMSWVCSECGEFTMKSGGFGVVTCHHIGAATRDMPRQTALAMAAAIIPRRAQKATFPEQTRVEGRTSPASTDRSHKRFDRNGDRDRAFREVTGPVRVRPVTEGDRERLRLARARKAKVCSP